MSSEVQTQPRWILSFADLLSVVLSFLVLAYSMSLPPDTKPTDFSKKGQTEFGINKARYTEDIGITRNSQDLSSNYLYQVMEKKIAADEILAPKVTLRSKGDSLVMTLKADSFTESSLPLAQLLKVVKNDVWIYSNNLGTSRKAYEDLQKRGFDQNITIMESDIPASQIDIVVHP